MDAWLQSNVVLIEGFKGVKRVSSTIRPDWVIFHSSQPPYHTMSGAYLPVVCWFIQKKGNELSMEYAKAAVVIVISRNFWRPCKFR